MTEVFVILLYSLFVAPRGSVLIGDLVRVSRCSLEMLMIAFRISGVLGVSAPLAGVAVDKFAEAAETLREIELRLPDIVSGTCNIYWSLMGVIKCYKWLVFSFSARHNILAPVSASREGRG